MYYKCGLSGKPDGTVGAFVMNIRRPESCLIMGARWGIWNIYSKAEQRGARNYGEAMYYLLDDVERPKPRGYGRIEKAGVLRNLEIEILKIDSVYSVIKTGEGNIFYRTRPGAERELLFTYSINRTAGGQIIVVKKETLSDD